MSWTRRSRAVLAVCVLLPAGSAGCGAGDAREPARAHATASAAPVGELLDDTDAEGRRYREVAAEHAPEVGVEVQPGTGGDWDIRLSVRNFRFSPPGTRAEARPGRGLAYLYLDDGLVTRLRGPGHRLAARLVPRGTHHVTVRLHADDGTVWAVAGEPVENTADITVSGPRPTAAEGPRPTAAEGPEPTAAERPGATGGERPGASTGEGPGATGAAGPGAVAARGAG
ncbi:hypothetical protein [Streptomyces leeuwenhoekii]|uniref:hypothetical protein n=1 Tax=Streptomyces leeuwenhoekii TaxID=1437453 RepID=UPI001F5C28DE|nr:hypothetical protein [Streptomyces leeuwenhoekii]